MRIPRSSNSARINSALQGLHNKAQGQRHCRATLGCEPSEPKNPDGVPQPCGIGCNPFRVEEAIEVSFVPGWRYAAGLLRLPWASFLNTFGVRGIRVTAFIGLALMVGLGTSRRTRAEVIIIEREDPSELTIYVMTVTPAPEPKPALEVSLPRAAGRSHSCQRRHAVLQSDVRTKGLIRSVQCQN